MSPENNHLFLAPPEDLHRASSAYPDHALTTDDEDDASLSGSDEEYTDEDDDGSHLSLINSHSREEDVALVGSFRRTSFVYGQRSAFVPSSPLSTALSALTANERETMLVQERELLNDNKYVSNSKSYGTSELYGPRPGSSASSIAPLGPPAFPVSERTGLLSATAPEWEEAVEAGAINTTYLRELKVLAKSAPLLYITFALQYSLTVASIFSAGRLGKSELAGVSLGSMTATITGYAVYQGWSCLLGQEGNKTF